MPQPAPLTYLDRKGLAPNAKYVFISYSHKSCDNVYACLNALYEKGLNFWYDKELRLGDNWLERVEKCYADERCCGAIFFFDENSLKGDAIEKEIKLFNRYKQIKPNMFAFCVVPAEAGSVYCVVRNAMVSLANASDRDLQEALPESRVITVLSTFNKDFLYQVQTGNYVEQMIENVRGHAPMAISDDVTALDTLKSKFACNEVNGVVELTLGKFPQMRSTAGGLHFADDKNRTNGREQELYFCEEGTFAVQPIVWLLLEMGNDVATLVSKKVLKTIDGYPSSARDAATLLEGGFSEREKSALVGRAQLVSAAHVDKLGGKLHEFEFTDYAQETSDGFLSAVWLRETVGAKRKVLCGLSGNPDDVIDEHQDSINGFMPCIQISLK